MSKKCIICGEEASFKIKDTADFYCPSCAEENFGDITMLVKLEEEAQRLKEFIKEKTNQSDGEEDVSTNQDRED